MTFGLAEARKAPEKQAEPREVNILVIDSDEKLLSAMWHALDSDGWQIRAVAEAGQVLPALAAQEWTGVIANVSITGLSGPVFETLKALSQAPAIEENHRRARVLFLVPESQALEACAVLEIARLPYTFTPINLHDLLEKVSDLMLEAQALANPIRRVRQLRGHGRGQQVQRTVFNKRQMPSMIAPREDYSMTEEEIAEFEAQEAAQRQICTDKKKDPKDLGAPAQR